ncbi:putative deacylase [Phyllobacterium sp. 1468]|uniref:M14 family metallopeptidase n=1 Tax=Phyllobacterium sp. 1468 TaxID=2817759 RepID=UPI002865156B|nr:succinylglutamate desuccinylase/aspartoacylase family protein [Phyllobacterium sp. 1468]MDR6632285.1 putative deacylase [Phyllobacterium sp. 1468]
MSLDRRDFMLATVGGAAASIALASDHASAQTATAKLAGGTVYTGDTVDGKLVVSTLGVADLELGKLHRLYFRGVKGPSGQPWLVSVAVLRGAKPGKRVTLVSGVHGDEMSSIHAVQTIIKGLDPAAMSGTVMAVFDVSRPAIESMGRRWPNSGRGADLVDLNRVWPGDENGPGAPARHAGLLFNRLIRPNSDYVLDFHTAGTGLDAAAFHLAKMDVPEVRAMAELFPIDQIFDNPGYPGLLTDALDQVGIPAFTPEIGNARRLDLTMIPLFVEGTMNVLKLHGIIDGPMRRTGRDTRIFVGNSLFPVLATAGGIVEHLVKLTDTVSPGQKIAIQRDMFGEIVAEYTSPVDGEIGGLRSDATSEPGNVLAFILFDQATSSGAEAYPE